MHPARTRVLGLSKAGGKKYSHRLRCWLSSTCTWDRRSLCDGLAAALCVALSVLLPVLRGSAFKHR